MLKIFSIELVVFLNVLVEVLAENKTDTINKLEKEKNKLFEDINTAIDESVLFLKSDNDSNASLGATYMEQLKQQLKDIHTSDFKNIELTNDTRRNSQVMMTISELANVFQKNKSKNKLESNINKIEIQKKIDQWMLQREAEKKKIRDYRQKKKLIFKPEKCPRYGVGKEKPKSLRRAGKNLKVPKSLPKYPCCRKCCKKSYMGCL